MLIPNDLPSPWNVTEIIVFAYIENRAYKLRSPLVLEPGEYRASIDKNAKRVRLLIKDKNGKLKTIKLDVPGVVDTRKNGPDGVGA